MKGKKIFIFTLLALLTCIIAALIIYISPKRYSKFIKNKDIEYVTFIYPEYSAPYGLRKATIPESNYDELENMLNGMKYKMSLSVLKSLAEECLEISYKNGNVVYISTTMLKKNSNNCIYLLDSTFDYLQVKTLIDESTIESIDRTEFPLH